MKNFCLSILAILFIANAGYSQLAYYDTKDITRELIEVQGSKFSFKKDTQSIKKLAAILKEYLPEPFRDDTLTTGQIFAFYLDNIFIGAQLDSLMAGATADLVSGGSKNKSLPSTVSISNLADGIARFLIKRGKEELNAAFFNRLKKFLDSHDECKILFPATSEFFGNIATYRFAELIQSLREAFQKDLSNLIVGLDQLIDLPKYQELLKELPEIRLAIRSVKIVSELSQSSTDNNINPALVIKHLAALNEWEEIHPNLGSSWKLLNIISETLRSNSADHIWIKLDELNSLVNSRVELTIFLGLFYQRAGSISFTVNLESITVKKYVDSLMLKGTILQVASLVENFALLANDIDRTITDLRSKLPNGSLANEDYYTYINKAISIIDYGFKVANTIKPGLNANKYILIARHSNDLYKSIFTKNYNNAVTDLFHILDELFDNTEELASLKVYAKIADSIAKSTDLSLKQYLLKNGKKIVDSIVAANLSVAKKKLMDPKVIEGILKYGNFFASVIKAESAEDVQNAIEAAALPAGSYSIKQKSLFNVSVNGYIGYGWDINEGSGVYAPVGISVSKGLSKKFGGAVSLFVAVIDVGSIASYRLKNGDDEELKQEVRLESIFAPGVQLFFAIPKTPIAFGPGWRMTPKLFYSNDTEFTVVNSKSVFTFSVVIDIPFFSITNTPFKR